MGSGLPPSQRQCTALLLLVPSAASAKPVVPSSPTLFHRPTRPPASATRLSAMSAGPPRKAASRGVSVIPGGREKKGKVETGPPPSHTMFCFFCKEAGPTVTVSSSLLESIMKVKSYMCIPLQARDQPASSIVLCSKCLDIVSQIEGWVDLLRQRIFDAHEGAVLYPETPPWLRALAAASAAPPAPPKAAVPGHRTASPSVALSPSPGEKRRAAPVPTGAPAAPIPPKKIAAAAANAATAAATANAATTAKEDGVSFLTLPISAADFAAANSAALPFLTVPVSSAAAVTAAGPNEAAVSPAVSSAGSDAAAAALSKNAMRSAIHSLTSLVNVVRASPKARGTAGSRDEGSKEPPPQPPPPLPPQPPLEETRRAPDVVKEEPVANNGDDGKSSPFDILQRWCAVCSSSYHNDSVFKRHIVSTHPELCFKCDLCGQLFATSSSRDIHVSHGCCERPTNRTRVLRCTDCHATFLGKYELKRHVLLTSHMGGVSGQA